MFITRATAKRVGLALLPHVVVCLHLGVGLSYVVLLVIAARQDLFWRADFTAFYTGWSIVRHGQGAQLYDFDVQAQYQRSALGEHGAGARLLPYINPPHVTVPLVPLAWLSRPAAYRAWMLVQAVLLAWLLRLLWRVARDWTVVERRLLITGVVAFPPLLITFLLGSFSTLVLICLVQSYLSLKSSREMRGGLWLALGTIKPQLVLLPGLALLAARRWRALGGALLLIGGLVLLSIAVLGWRSWLDYWVVIRTVNHSFGTLGVIPTAMYNLKGTLTLWLSNSRAAVINGVAYAALMVAVLGTLILWRGAWRPEAPEFELRLALTILLGLLFSPHLNPQDGLLLVAPATLFYLYLRERGLPRRAYACFALSWPVLFLITEFTIEGGWGMRLPVVVMVVLLGWIGKALYRARSAHFAKDES